MKIITNSEEWLDRERPNNEAVYSLYLIVERGIPVDECPYYYKCWYSYEGDSLFIQASHTQELLFLESYSAQADFLDLLRIRFCGGMDIGEWYESERNT